MKMDELFIKTEQGIFLIEPAITNKYKLKKGGKAPFTNGIITDKNGDATPEKEEITNTLPEPDRNTQIFTTAETLDIAQGADSYN